MFDEYIKESRKLEKFLNEFHEKASASLKQSIGNQPPEFKKAVGDIIARAKNGEVDPKTTAEEIEKLKKMSNGDNT